MSQAKQARKFNPFACQFPGETAANLLWNQGYYDANGDHILPVNVHKNQGNISIQWPDGSILQLN